MGKVKMTKDVKKANAITHDGTFHADEILATIILSKIRDIILCRVSKVPKNVADDVIVYDIGGGRFDHHQKDGNGARKNGVKYASAGLIWREFGRQVVANTPNPELVWYIIDRDLIQGVDASDTATCQRSNCSARSMSLSRIVSGFNPTWDSSEDKDEAFAKTLCFCETVFDNVLKDAVSKANAQPIIEEAIEKSENHIMILDKYASWQDCVFLSKNPKAKELLFVVYPSDRGGYNWRCVPYAPGGYKQRKPVPIEWRGLRDKAIQQVTGIKTATFCHRGGFIGGAETFEDAVAMAKLAIEASS